MSNVVADAPPFSVGDKVIHLSKNKVATVVEVNYGLGYLIRHSKTTWSVPESALKLVQKASGSLIEATSTRKKG